METRWWSTHACLERLLYLRAAITMHEASIVNSSNTYDARILSDKHWAVIEYIVLLVGAIHVGPASARGRKVRHTINLVVPNIQALRLGLRDGMEELQAEIPAGTPTDKAEARAIVLPCALALSMILIAVGGTAAPVSSTGPVHANSLKASSVGS